jgi:hypothetical protein
MTHSAHGANVGKEVGPAARPCGASPLSERWRIQGDVRVRKATRQLSAAIWGRRMDMSPTASGNSHLLEGVSRTQLTPHQPLRIQTLGPGSISICATTNSRQQVVDFVGPRFSNEEALGVLLGVSVGIQSAYPHGRYPHVTDGTRSSIPLVIDLEYTDR